MPYISIHVIPIKNLRWWGEFRETNVRELNVKERHNDPKKALWQR